MLADRHPRAGGVNQAHRFIRQLPRRNIARRKLHRRLDALIEHLHLVVLLQHSGNAPHHQNRLFLVRLIDNHRLEPPCQRRVFFDMLFIFGPCGRADGPQGAPRQRRLQQVGRIAGARRAARAHQCVGFVNKHNNRNFRALHLLDHLLKPVFKLALHRSPRLQQAHIQLQKLGPLQRGRHIAPRNPQRKALDNGGFANASLSRQNRVILPPSHQHINDLPYLLIPPDNRINLAIARFFRQISAVSLQRLARAHLRRGHGACRLAGHRPTADTILRGQAIFGRPCADVIKIIGQLVSLHLAELGRNAAQSPHQGFGFHHAQNQMPRADLRGFVHQAGIHPRPLHRVFKMLGKVANAARAPWQRIQRIGKIFGHTACIKVKMPDNPVDVAILPLQDLVQPVHKLHIGVAAHFAKNRGPFNGFIPELVQLPE